jgi:tetratricopeptide (TPR) repeat protein
LRLPGIAHYNHRVRAQTTLLLLTALSVTVAIVSADAITHTVPIDPKVASLVKQALSADKLKQYDLAIRTYSEALQMKPDTTTAAAIYSWRAGAYGQKGEFGEGMSDASESIRLNPQYFNGYNERGIIYRRTGKLDQAISSFDTAIHLNPNFARAYNNRANAYSDKKDYNQAIRDYSEAIRRQDRTMQSDFYLNRAQTYREMGALDKASADCDQAIRINPTYGRGYMERGNVYSAKGNYSRAASDFENATRLSPKDVYVIANFSWFQATCPNASLRNGKQALEKSKKACELTHWQDHHPVDNLAAAYAEVGDFDNAIKYETQALNKKGINEATRKEMQERLELYRQHKPYRQESKFKAHPS